jgi:hypothetical protein
MRLVPVLWTAVNTQWPRIERFVIDACQRGPLDADAQALRDGCVSRNHQLWIVEDEHGEAVAVVITQIAGDACEWLAVGGVGMEKWKFLEIIIERWAQENGCSLMRSFSRRGMVKRLPEYKIRGVILEKGI